MKTSKVSELLGMDFKTIVAWTDHEKLNKFFSEPAKKNDKTRTYNEDDIRVLNTIRVARESNTDWMEIAASLDTGYRDHDMPPSALLVDTTTTLVQYSKFALAQQKIEDLEHQLEEKEDKLADAQETIAELREQIGLLKGMMRSNDIDPNTGKRLADK